MVQAVLMHDWHPIGLTSLLGQDEQYSHTLNRMRYVAFGSINDFGFC